MTQLSPDQLNKNASLINAAHRAVVSANRTSIEKAIEAGTMLKACKDGMAHGEWSKWLHDNCHEISEETARLYMRLADPKNAPKLEEAAKQNGNAVADLSVRGAANLLRKEPTAEQKVAREAKKADKQRAKAVDDAARAAALIPKQLRGMGVDDVLRLLTATFDVDYLDTLSEALQKHLKEEDKVPPLTSTLTPPPAAAPSVAIGGSRRPLSPT
jgi:DUF3102 family protein